MLVSYELQWTANTASTYSQSRLDPTECLIRSVAFNDSLISFSVAANQSLLSVTMRCIIAVITTEKIHRRSKMNWPQNAFIS